MRSKRETGDKRTAFNHQIVLGNRRYRKRKDHPTKRCCRATMTGSCPNNSFPSFFNCLIIESKFVNQSFEIIIEIQTCVLFIVIVGNLYLHKSFDNVDFQQGVFPHKIFFKQYKSD